MNYKKEIIMNFPLNKEKRNNLKKENVMDIGTDFNERLNRFYNLTEKLRETEWHQEYFLIYNSYVIENA